MTFLYEQPTVEFSTPEQQLEQDIALVLQTALAHHHKGEFSDAEALYQAILEAKPQHADVLYNLGVLLGQTGRSKDALAHFELILGLQPNNGQYWAAYISALIDAGETAAAWLALEMGQKQGLRGPAVDGLIVRMSNPGRVIATRPISPEPEQAKNGANAGTDADTVNAASEQGKSTIAAGRRISQQETSRFTSLYNKGQIAEAVKLASTFTQRFPLDGNAWRWLGIALHRLGKYDEALVPLRKVAELLPDELESRTVLADILRLKGLPKDAEEVCRAILAINVDHAEAHRIIGMSLLQQGRVAEGLAASRRAIELAPDNSSMLNTLGVLLLDLGLVTEAEQSFRVALEKDPKDAIAANNFLFALTHDPEVDHETLFAEHRNFAKQHETPLRPQWPRHANKKTPDRKLKIGLVSGDLFRHAVASYLLPIMELLAKDPSVSLHVYNNHIAEDDYTHLLRNCADEWHQITGMPDARLANKIRDERIDILIDLSGHTGRNRLLTFVRKPAPIQVSWLGYPATTGLSSMDYYLADRFGVPFGAAERLFSEKIVHLPANATFLPEKSAPPVNILPAMHNGYVTFGSFNRLNKLRADVIALWAQLLHAQPTSRMLLGAITTDEDEQLLIKWFANAGIGPERLMFRRRSSIPVYLQQHFHVDICLDTFPYTGSTTVLNSLWMGVPTLTIAGDTLPSRAGTTWMSHVGLEQFLAADKEDFVRRGVALSSDLPALAALRTGLRERCNASAAFRPEVVASGLSQALRIMWKRWCEGLPAVAFQVSTEEAIAATATVGVNAPCETGENK
ncbi:O-linked N-acetylglucosamine transferase, SPINDLY family protein [Paraburkholderia rhynchosiae]|uniref:protein O-GlcNAc transferase n=1 Tax=Paraburkholderia rhynchosiae TaxID=487049 RepID=A0A2N7WGQ8_9BURK|nr:tetratricopeptide repeat protein [Paraburkholderia rhynchosiae]PMS28607.1 glycosyltransferase [Paraburkholderia rhynchosiae]CAB3713505.1 Cell division coordinator CpoB [Paraburkholderia rhynchosiae]